VVTPIASARANAGSVFSGASPRPPRCACKSTVEAQPASMATSSKTAIRFMTITMGAVGASIIAAMAHRKKTLYDILGVPRDASAADIALAFDRQKAELERAPGSDANAAIVLREAYDVLKDPRRRASYDASLLTAEERSAALEQAPDLEIETEEAQRNLPWIPIAIGAIVLLAILFIALRPGRTPSPQPAPEPQAAAEPAKPAPQAPKLKSGAEIMADATTSGGALLSLSMSGQSIPIGMAISTELGTMITTCHGIPGGVKLVVRVGNESHPADLLITDETLDLCKLQVANFGVPPVSLAADEPRAGDRIFAVGVNAQGTPAVTEGTIKQVLVTTEGRLFELSMPIGQYSSGGGVFDAYGRLVGIATVQRKSGLSIALPVASIASMRSRGATQ
jgi:hypothetical protein